MKIQSLLPTILLGMILLIVAFRPTSTSFDKITVHEFELTDQSGIKRASIKVEPEGEVVFRLHGQKGTIRVKLGATEDGSGFVLLDDKTNPDVHILAKKDRVGLTITGKDGKKREY